MDVLTLQLKLLLEQLEFIEEQVAAVEEQMKKLIIFAELNASVRESCQFVGTRDHISKRNSLYLRKTIWQAAVISCRFNPKLREFYQKKLKEGKAPMIAQGAVARRLTHTIYAILKTGQDYNVNL